MISHNFIKSIEAKTVKGKLEIAQIIVAEIAALTLSTDSVPHGAPPPSHRI